MKNVTSLAFVVALVAFIPLAASGQAQRGDLASLFPSQAAIEAPAGGRLVRLDLPTEVIAACRADLSDLRIFDAAGREVPFVVESGAGDAAALEAVTTVPAEILEASHAITERERSPSLRRETYILPAPPPAPAGTGWVLVLDVGAIDFVSQIEAREAGVGGGTPSGGEAVDQAGAVVAAQGAVVASGSLFRLREVGAEKLGLALTGAIAGPRLLVTLDTDAARFLEPSFHYESRRRIEGGAELEAPLEQSERQAGEGTTVIVLERPAGLVPARLRVGSSTPFFDRAIAVWDEGTGARTGELGSGRVFRVQAAARVEQLELPLEPARGESLRLVIEDGDSPALDGVTVTAVLPRPALLFALAGDAAAATATLRFGGGRALRPRYDVAALMPPLPAAGADAAVGEILYDEARLPAAALGAIVANPAYDPQPALAWAWRPGAAIDPRLWSHRVALAARPSTEGLSQVRLGVEELGIARADLADLRIVDGVNRQWAYLLAPGAAQVTLPLRIDGPATRDRATRWTFDPPAAPATADRLVLRTPVAYFDRPFELVARLGDAKRTIASGRLTRTGGDPRPVLIVFPATRFDHLDLEVTDADDGPLELAGAEARFPQPELFFAAPEGSYSLLVGYPEATAPSYELERVREVVLAARAAPIEADALAANPEFSAGARLASGEGWQRVLLWGAIVLLVGFLTVLTLRLARGGGT